MVAEGRGTEGDNISDKNIQILQTSLTTLPRKEGVTYQEGQWQAPMRELKVHMKQTKG